MLLLYVLLAVAIVVAVIIAIVALGIDRFVAAWKHIPVQGRTIINVAIGAIFAWAISDGLQLLLALDLPPWLKVLLAGVCTALVRAGNPADNAYGKVVEGTVVDEAVDAGALPPAVD